MSTGGWAIAAGLALAAGGAGHLGWLTALAEWDAATGWQRIPESERPPAGAGALEGGPRLGWLGHAGWLLEWGGTRLAIDPDLSSRCTLARRRLQPPLGAAELGRLDAVLITHAHFDHLDLPTLSALPAVGCFAVPRGSEEYLGSVHSGSPRHGLAPHESLRVGDLEVIAVPAFHHGSRLHPLASRKLAVGWVVRRGEAAIYFAGDTGRGNDFASLRERYRPRWAVLPIGAYAPAWPIGRVHLSPEQAVEVARELGVELAIPSHFATFALAADRPDAALPRFAAAARRAGLAWAMPRPPAAGGAEG